MAHWSSSNWADRKANQRPKLPKAAPFRPSSALNQPNQQIPHNESGELIENPNFLDKLNAKAENQPLLPHRYTAALTGRIQARN